MRCFSIRLMQIPSSRGSTVACLVFLLFLGPTQVEAQTEGKVAVGKVKEDCESATSCKCSAPIEATFCRQRHKRTITWDVKGERAFVGCGSPGPIIDASFTCDDFAKGKTSLDEKLPGHSTGNLNEKYEMCQQKVCCDSKLLKKKRDELARLSFLHEQKVDLWAEYRAQIRAKNQEIKDLTVSFVTGSLQRYYDQLLESYKNIFPILRAGDVPDYVKRIKEFKRGKDLLGPEDLRRELTKAVTVSFPPSFGQFLA